MLIGLLSDTHDNAANTAAGLALLRDAGAEALLHAGDLVSPDMLAHFENLGIPFHFVLGNNEYDPAALRTRASANGLFFSPEFADVTLGNKRLAVTHGHEGALLSQLIRSGKYAYVIHGHTHVRRDERVGPTRIINPGALHRARVKTVALLDTAADALRFLELPPAG
jgi:putative phosphoesterase